MLGRGAIEHNKNLLGPTPIFCSGAPKVRASSDHFGSVSPNRIARPWNLAISTIIVNLSGPGRASEGFRFEKIYRTVVEERFPVIEETTVDRRPFPRLTTETAISPADRIRDQDTLLTFGANLFMASKFKYLWDSR